jgi:hypothetical protein
VVARDRDEPRCRPPAVRVELAGPTPDAYEGFLQRLLGEIAPPQDRDQAGEQARTRQSIEFGERCLVLQGAAAEQVLQDAGVRVRIRKRVRE